MHITHICSEFSAWCSLSSLALFHHHPSSRLLGGPQGRREATAAAVGPRNTRTRTTQSQSKSPCAVQAVAPHQDTGTCLGLGGDRASRLPQEVASRWAPQPQRAYLRMMQAAIYSSTASVGWQQPPGPGQASEANSSTIQQSPGAALITIYRATARPGGPISNPSLGLAL